MKACLYPKIIILLALVLVFTSNSCRKIREGNEDPEIEPIKHGFQTSAAIGYCASIAYTFFNGGVLPDNVILQSQNNGEGTHSAIFLVNINDEYPLPFNDEIGQIFIAGIWGNNGGVITAIFTDINIIEDKYKLVAIHTIPVIEIEKGEIMTLMAEQDIVIGENNDPLIHLNMSNPQINIEINRLATEQPNEPFVAAQQNVWFVNVDQKNTSNNSNDDEYTINGGGQIAEISSKTGGMLYHAMICTKFTNSVCNLNPISGVGFIQNLKIGEETDLGHIFLNFHENCDGKAYVELATGKYLRSNHKKVNLNFH